MVDRAIAGKAPGLFAPGLFGPGLFANMSIGRKIVGLSVVILSLMLASAVYAFVQAIKVHGTSGELVRTLEPLARDLAVIEAHKLEEALLVERALRHAGPHVPDPVRDGSEIDRFQIVSKEISGRIDRTADRLGAAAATARDASVALGLGQLDLELAAVRREHQRYDAGARGLLQSAGAADAVMRNKEAAFSIEEERLTEALDRLAARAASLAAREEARLGSLENRQFLVSTENLAVAIVAFLAGTLLSSLLTRRMLRPVHSLIAGTEEIARGNFEVSLPAPARDEIGRLTSAFQEMASELRSKAVIRETFGSYVDPRVVDRLLGDDREALEAGARHEMSVLFADLEGFSTMAEALTPTALVRLINRYLALVSEPVAEHQGVIDKYIGDAVMAFWGAPFVEGDFAVPACRAALAQYRQLEKLRLELPELLGLRKNIPSIRMRVGLATGEVVVGSIGAKFSKSFTVVGDVVNIASRLEMANKIYGTSILVDEATMARAGSEIVAREIDRLAVAGKDEAVRIFELLGTPDDIAPSGLALRAAFERGLAAYRARDWAGAEAGFAEASRIVPGDPPSMVFLERIAGFRQTPPSDDWAATWRSVVK